MPAIPLLLTRPAPDAARFADAWRTAVGADAPVVIAPVSEIVVLAGKVAVPASTTPIFTSANAPRCAAPGNGRRAWCVGRRTAEAALSAGFEPVSADGDADALVAAIRQSGETGPFLHLRGREARGDVAGRLRAAGLRCDERVVYEQRALPLTDEARTLLSGALPVLVPLFSPASARRLSRAMADCIPLAPLRVAAMSEAVLQCWDGPAPQAALVAETPDASSMMETLRRLGAAPDQP